MAGAGAALAGAFLGAGAGIGAVLGEADFFPLTPLTAG